MDTCRLWKGRCARRKFTAQFKAKVVLEVLSGAKAPAQACRHYGIKDSLLYKWRREFLEKAPMVFEKKGTTWPSTRPGSRSSSGWWGDSLWSLKPQKSLAACDLTPGRKREIAHMLTEEGCPVGVACRAVGLSRSNFYYRSKPKGEQRLKGTIEELVAVYPTCGSRRITAMLRRLPCSFCVNRKRVRRLMREMGLLREPKRKGVVTTDSRHYHRRFPNLVAGLEVVWPDQVWAADITYIRLKEGFVYLAVVMDVYTRGIRGWALSRFLDPRLTLKVLEMALEKDIPEIHHSDQGVQYAAGEYVKVLLEHGVKISMASAGRPDQNGYAERLIRTIVEEEVELSEYKGFWDARERIGEFIDEVYQKKRIHSALGYLTPEEFEERWHRERANVGLLSKDSPKSVQLLGSTTDRVRASIDESLKFRGYDRHIACGCEKFEGRGLLQERDGCIETREVP